MSGWVQRICLPTVPQHQSGGKVSDIWGRKPVLLIAISIFFVGSTLSATSVSMKMLVAGRAVQGLGGGGLLTLSNMVISDLFSMRFYSRTLPLC